MLCTAFGLVVQLLHGAHGDAGFVFGVAGWTYTDFQRPETNTNLHGAVYSDCMDAIQNLKADTARYTQNCFTDNHAIETGPYAGNKATVASRSSTCSIQLVTSSDTPTGDAVTCGKVADIANEIAGVFRNMVLFPDNTVQGQTSGMSTAADGSFWLAVAGCDSIPLVPCPVGWASPAANPAGGQACGSDADCSAGFTCQSTRVGTKSCQGGFTGPGNPQSGANSPADRAAVAAATGSSNYTASGAPISPTSGGSVAIPGVSGAVSTSVPLTITPAAAPADSPSSAIPGNTTVANITYIVATPLVSPPTPLPSPYGA